MEEPHLFRTEQKSTGGQHFAVHGDDLGKSSQTVYISEEEVTVVAVVKMLVGDKVRISKDYNTSPSFVDHRTDGKGSLLVFQFVELRFFSGGKIFFDPALATSPCQWLDFETFGKPFLRNQSGRSCKINLSESKSVLIPWNQRMVKVCLLYTSDAADE